jgi:hypothetical protein
LGKDCGGNPGWRHRAEGGGKKDIQSGDYRRTPNLVCGENRRFGLFEAALAGRHVTFATV